MSNGKIAAAPVTPIRQRSQYSCMAASLCMCLRAHDVDVDEELVNNVMGAKAMQGASWEQLFAAAQHFGQRVTFICPATIRQLKEYTDRGVPLVIAWNPEGRPWGHASVVFDVDDDLNVHVADPNIPDPEKTVRIVPKAEFYGKWYEKFNDYLVRRPACAIEPEITQDGKQRVASVRGQTEHLMMLDEHSYWGPTAALQPVDKALKVVTKALKRLDPVRLAGNRGIERHLAPKPNSKKAAPIWQRKDVVREIKAIPHIRPHRGDQEFILTLPGQDKKWKPATDYFRIVVPQKDEFRPFSPAVSIYWVGNDIDYADSLKQKGYKKGASYSGNPDGDRIYPGKEFDHGYDEPLAGGTDVMRQLQNRLREEQGREPRRESPKVGAQRVAERYIKRGMK